MEALLLLAAVREVAGGLPGRVQAVLQPSAREVVLAVGGRPTRHLLLSTDPAAARLHLLGRRPAAIPAPTAFCRLLRRRLEGNVLVAVTMPGLERAVTLAFAVPGRLERPELLLVAEIMGKHSNLVLVDPATGLVVDALQHVEPPMSRVRTVLPGLPYDRPPGGDRPPLGGGDGEAFAALWGEAGGRGARLFGKVLGLGPGLLALAEAGARADPAYAADPGLAVYRAARACVEAVARGEARATIYEDRGLLLPLEIPGAAGEPHRTFPAVGAAAEAFYGAARAGRELARLREAEERRLRRALAKAAGEERRLGDEAGEDARADLLQEAGRALLGAGLPRGATVIALPSPAGGGPREVVLDPALDARQNAERLFQAARKARRRAALARGKLPAASGRRRLLEEEIAVVAGLGIDELRGRASRGRGAVRRGGARTAAAPAPAGAGVREYRSRGGWRILVGKSGAGNERLTGRLAAPEDWWFHVRDYPGAHVVLKLAVPGAPPEAAIREAGEIAAWHSGARTQGLVDVAYTRRKHVRKVKGAPPGKVVLGESATVRVRPRLPADLAGDGPGA